MPDTTTRMLLAKTGVLDAIEVAGLDVDAVRATTTNIVDYLQLNLHAPRLAQRRVRYALAQAIDRRRLATAVYRSTLVPTDSVQLDPRYRATQPLPAFDPVAARRSLGAEPLSLDLAIAAHWRNSASAAIVIAADLGRAGIVTTIRPYSEATFWGAKDAGGILENARYDLALTSWSPALDPDRSYLFGCGAWPPKAAIRCFSAIRDTTAMSSAGRRRMQLIDARRTIGMPGTGLLLPYR